MGVRLAVVKRDRQFLGLLVVVTAGQGCGFKQDQAFTP